MGAFRQLHLAEHPEPLTAAMNMAVDEALLETARTPTLRFYRWQRPALSFGYFGLFAEVVAQAAHRDVVRRWTGGGIVLHGVDLTYSIILPRAHEQEQPSSREAYVAIHRAIQRELSGSAEVSLASNNAPKISEACFANPVVADVMVDGRKIAGAAHRRTRAGLLHQGSIQYEDLPDSFRESFTAALCPNFATHELPRAVLERAQVLAREKYETDTWLRRR